MSKTWIVFKSEYLRRVLSRSFILTTLLVPVAVALLIAVVVFLSVQALTDSEQRTIVVQDQTGQLLPTLVASSDDQYTFVAADVPEDSVRAAVIAGRYNGYLDIPAGLILGEGRPSYYAVEGGGSSIENRIEDRLERAVREIRLQEQNVAPEVLEMLNARVSLRMVKLSESGEEAGNAEFFFVVGFFMGMLIFMMMLIYGQVVMQGVIDEKASRVVEIVVSSVRPFQLMMGKITAIGAMGLTQIIAWTVLIGIASYGVGAVVMLFIDPATLTQNLPQGAAVPTSPGLGDVIAAAGIDLPKLEVSLFGWFVLYFLFGYLMFATLYAAVGSIVESQQDAQGYLLPIMLPIIIAIYTLMPQIESPNSALAVTFSMFPLTSPISMMVRMSVTDVAFWQVLLSFLILVGSFFGGTWLCARIYRVGILMYGKKPSPKELLKWIRYA